MPFWGTFALFIFKRPSTCGPDRAPYLIKPQDGLNSGARPDETSAKNKKKIRAERYKSTKVSVVENAKDKAISSDMIQEWTSHTASIAKLEEGMENMSFLKHQFDSDVRLE